MGRISRVLIIFFVFIALGVNRCFADNISDAIESYKSGNYENCISIMKTVTKNDPTDVIGYYYLALSYSKLGKLSESIQNYNKVIALNSDETLTELAKKGKASLSSLAKTSEEPEDEYNPIFNDYSVNNTQKSSKTQPEVTEKIKTSSNSDVQKPQVKSAKFEFDPNREPTNDEIVNAIKILQKAGLLQNGAFNLSGGGYNQAQQQIPVDTRTQQMQSMLMMMNGGNNNNSNMMQMMPYLNNGGKVDPQVMQMMLMNQMMPNFSGGNNNNGY